MREEKKTNEEGNKNIDERETDWLLPIHALMSNGTHSHFSVWDDAPAE